MLFATFFFCLGEPLFVRFFLRPAKDLLGGRTAGPLDDTPNPSTSSTLVREFHIRSHSSSPSLVVSSSCLPRPRSCFHPSHPIHSWSGTPAPSSFHFSHSIHICGAPVWLLPGAVVRTRILHFCHSLSLRGWKQGIRDSSQQRS